MRLDWSTKSVGKPFCRFNKWLKQEEGIYRLSFAPEERRPEIIRKYLTDHDLEDIELGAYASNHTVIRFRLKQTGSYWHKSTWGGFYQRGQKGNCIDANQTLILNPLIEDVMSARGTPCLRIEGANNDEKKIYFYSERYNWICCQDWKTIRKGCIDHQGYVTPVSPSNWQHDFRSICGKTEFVQCLIWNQFRGIVDEDWEYNSPRGKIPCISFDGFDGIFNLNNILTGNTTQFTLKSAPDRTQHLKEVLSRQGFIKTGKPWILDEDSFDVKCWNSQKPIPYIAWDEEYGKERFRVYWEHLFDDERTNKRLEGAWDRTEFIKNRFAKKGYQVPDEWTYQADANYRSRPIPFRYQGKWYRMTWDYFQSGVRVGCDNYLYFVTLQDGEHSVLKIGITQNELFKRYPKNKLVDVHYITECRSEPQIREVETVMLFLTRKYSVAEHLPLAFDGRTEARNMEMNINKTINMIQKVFKDIDRKFQALPEII
jgi:hypothetical protein